MWPHIWKAERRPDRYWPWELTTMLTILKLKNPKWVSYSVIAPTDKSGGARFAPVGMLFLQCGTPALHDSDKKSVFVVYIAGAPDTLPSPKMVGQCLMDIALTVSFNQKFRGLLGLHASPARDDKNSALIDFYSKKMLMLRLRADRPIHMRFRNNDGNYYYYDETTAESIFRRMDGFRSVP